MSDSLYLYFQNLRTNNAECKTENGIDSDKIAVFLTTITEIFIDSLKNGLISINPENIHFESKHTTLFFKTALIELKDAIVHDCVTISLEFLLLAAAQDKTISNHELFELKLIAKLIPLMQKADAECIQRYTDILIQFGSNKIEHTLISELDTWALYRDAIHSYKCKDL